MNLPPCYLHTYIHTHALYIMVGLFVKWVYPTLEYGNRVKEGGGMKWNPPSQIE